MAVCENRVSLMDVLTKRVQELPRAALDGKPPSAIAFLFPQARAAAMMSAASSVAPVLAVACADGGVRLVQYGTLKARCADILHNSCIKPALHQACLSRLESVASGAAPVVAVACSDGSVCLCSMARSKVRSIAVLQGHGCFDMFSAIACGGVEATGKATMVSCNAADMVPRCSAPLLAWHAAPAAVQCAEMQGSQAPTVISSA